MIDPGGRPSALLVSNTALFVTYTGIDGFRNVKEQFCIARLSTFQLVSPLKNTRTWLNRPLRWRSKLAQ